VAQPTKDGYKFNAYYTEASGGKRLTVTMLTKAKTDSTAWVSDVTNYTGSGRTWAYNGAELTLYAQYKQERTITLDDQGATTAGTDKVVTAYCPNNNTVILPSITVPTKTNATFLGYYSEQEGGVQLVNNTGVFIKNVDGYITDNKWSYDKDITLYAHWVPNVITLDEGENNSAIIAQVAAAGLPTTVNTTRTITAGMYNTFCLPFEVDADMMAETFGSDYNLQEFTGATLNSENTVVTINFTKVNAMTAGKPYLIKTKADVKNPTFSGVTIVNSKDTIFGEGIVMRAIMNPTHITPGDHTHMIVISNDQMAWLQQDDESTMKGMRAYFHVENAQMQAALRNAAPHLNTNTTDTPTGTENVNANVNANRKMIIDNQLIIIRNGQMFNAQGALVK